MLRIMHWEIAEHSEYCVKGIVKPTKFASKLV